MIQLKIIARSFLSIIAVLLLSAYTVEITKDQIISKEKEQDNSTVSGAYEFQTIWQHSIPKSNTENGRISLTFRQML